MIKNNDMNAKRLFLILVTFTAPIIYSEDPKATSILANVYIGTVATVGCYLFIIRPWFTQQKNSNNPSSS